MHVIFQDNIIKEWTRLSRLSDSLWLLYNVCSDQVSQQVSKELGGKSISKSVVGTW